MSKFYWQQTEFISGKYEDKLMIIEINDIGEQRVIRGNEKDELLSGRTALYPFNNNIFGGAGNDTLRGDIANDDLIGDQGDDLLQGTFVCPPFQAKLAIIRKFDNEEFDTLTGGGGADRFILGELFESDSLLFGNSEPVYYDKAGIEDYALITDFNPEEDLIQLAGETTDYSLANTPDDLPEGTAIYLGAIEDNEVIAILSDTIIDNFSEGFDFMSNLDDISADV
ncbi:MAG: hypothetical protein QNJ53_02320 [Pleurocapsa sp. MO_192.B19]|nr:hypothetical protein [Pleurocapsa sp. MO_192.B19]